MNKSDDKQPLDADPWREVLKAARESGDPDRYFAQMEVDAAKAGSVDAAREILERFCNEVDASSPASWESVVRTPQYYFQAEYLAQCFRAILAGEDAAKALNIVHAGKGRPPVDTEKQQQMAACFWLLVGEGFTQEAVLDAMGEERSSPWHASRSTVRRAKDEWREFETMDRQTALSMFRNDDRLQKTRALLKK
jgi:hypothetical protein